MDPLPPPSPDPSGDSVPPPPRPGVPTLSDPPAWPAVTPAAPAVTPAAPAVTPAAPPWDVGALPLYAPPVGSQPVGNQPVGGPPERIAWMGFGAEQPRWGMPDILLGLLCWLVLQILVTLPVLAVTKDETTLSIVGLIGGWIGMVGYLVFIAHRKGLRSLRRDFGWDFRWVDPLIGLGVGIGTIMVSGIVRVIVAQAFSEPAGTNAERIFGSAENNHAALLVLALMAGIGAPIVEELFFRGLTLRAIERRFGGIAGIVGSSVVFALLHWQPGSLGSTVSLVSGILVYGLIFATVTRLFKRLGPSTFAHMTINTLASAFLLYTVFSGSPITG